MPVTNQSVESGMTFSFSTDIYEGWCCFLCSSEWWGRKNCLTFLVSGLVKRTVCTKQKYQARDLADSVPSQSSQFQVGKEVKNLKNGGSITHLIITKRVELRSRTIIFGIFAWVAFLSCFLCLQTMVSWCSKIIARKTFDAYLLPKQWHVKDSDLFSATRTIWISF